MTSGGLSLLNRNQRGFTLVELVMAIGVTGVFMAGIGAAVFQVFDVNTRSTTHMVAVKEVENAVHWITRDAERAQYSDNATYSISGSFEDSLTLSWVNDFDSNSGNVTYRQNGDRLERTFSDNGGSVTTNLVAQHIVSDNSSWSLSVSPYGAVLSFKITAVVNSAKPASETRSFDVVARSMP